jgi:hypothetical protein
MKYSNIPKGDVVSFPFFLSPYGSFLPKGEEKKAFLFPLGKLKLLTFYIIIQL